MIDISVRETSGVRYNELNQLITDARKAHWRRSRICLHGHAKSTLQQMLIALCADSYLPPHRQEDSHKGICLIEGRLIVLIYNENGSLEEFRILEVQSDDHPFLIHLSADRWHTVHSLSEISIFEETRSGEYNKETEFAIWAPDRDNRIHGLKYLQDQISTALNNEQR